MANATRISDTAHRYFIGHYTGTTAAQNIHIGFKPGWILAWDRTNGNVVWTWSTADQTGVVGMISGTVATNASVIEPVDDGTVIGFSLPASDSIVNLNDAVYDFIAYPAY